tara:strand:+ start:942 stop:1229 length:288 start_codon:yes stop_codon:yes gene_type:complete
MIKPKTKAQKKQDQTKLDQAAHKCAKAINSFVTELYEGEFRLDWIYFSTINKMQESDNKYQYAKKTQKEEFTFTSYEEDKDHKEWNNSTHIDKYK